MSGGLLTEQEKAAVSARLGKDIFGGRYITCSRNRACWVRRPTGWRVRPIRIEDQT